MSSPGKPVEIKMNERDQRMTPNYLAFPVNSDKSDMAAVEWIVGPDAERIWMRGDGHGIKNPISQLHDPQSHVFNGLPAVDTAATAIYHHLKSLKMKIDKVTLLVPVYSSPQYRQLLLLTTKLVGFKGVNILESPTAVGTFYSIEKIKKGSRKPVTVLFVDIGAENIDAYLWFFRPRGEKLRMELQHYRHSHLVGGNYVDQLLLEWARKQLDKPLVGSEPYIVLQHLRKAKERLAGGSSIEVNLNEDYGKILTINQELIRSMTANMTAKIKELLSDFPVPDEIELIGGGSRLQVFIDAVNEVFPTVGAKRSLNSDEAAALGGSYYSALKTGTVIGSKIELHKPAMLGLSTKFDGQEFVVYKAGDEIKDKKMSMVGNESRLIMNTLGDVKELWKTYGTDSEYFWKTRKNFDGILIEGLEQGMRAVKDDLTNGTVPTFSLKYGMSLDLDCPDLVGVSMIANITVASRKQALRGHGRTNFREIKLPVISIPYDEEYRIPANSSQFVADMISGDEERRKREESCHKFEAFIIETRDQAEFDSEMKSVTTEEERLELMQELDIARTTIDCTMLVNETSADLDQRLKDLRKRFEKPLERFEELQKRPNALRKLQVAMSRGKEAKKNARCDEETIEKYDKYVNETIDKINKLEQDGPLDQPSFKAEEMKEREKEILNKIAELQRPPKKKEIVNFSSENASDMDEDEIERLRNCGIMVGNDKKKKRKQDDDPVLKAQKEARLNEIETRYNASRKAWNATKKAYCEQRKAFEKEHMLPKQTCEIPNDRGERWRYRHWERYMERLARKKKAKEDRIAEEKRLAEEEQRRLEEERRRPPTPTPTPEEAERIRKQKEEEERRKRIIEETKQRIEEERRLFREASVGMFDEEELNKQDEDALYEKYKEMKKKYKNQSHRPFANEAEREKYEDERREYESLRKRFENDPVRKKEEQRKKREAKRRREAKEAKERNMTELDQKIEDALADERRLLLDERQLQEDIEDFERLKLQVVKREEHDKRKMRRMKKRDLLERKRRKEEWDEWSKTRKADLDLKEDEDKPNPGDTREDLEAQLEEYEDVPLDYESSFYDGMIGLRPNEQIPAPDEDLISDDDDEPDRESSSSSSEMSYERREERGRIENRIRDRFENRRAINPELRAQGFDDAEIDPYFQKLILKEEAKRFREGFKKDLRCNPTDLYARRFGTRHEESGGPSRHEPPPPNSDDNYMVDPRGEIQEDEMAEEL